MSKIFNIEEVKKSMANNVDMYDDDFIIKYLIFLQGYIEEKNKVRYV